MSDTPEVTPAERTVEIMLRCNSMEMLEAIGPAIKALADKGNPASKRLVEAIVKLGTKAQAEIEAAKK